MKIPEILDPNKTVNFTNSSIEDFSHTFDGKSMPVVKAGTSVWLTEPVAYLFAKHLAVRELNRLDRFGVGINELSIETKMEEYFGGEGISASSPEQLIAKQSAVKAEEVPVEKDEPKEEIKEDEVPVEPEKKKPGRPPKIKPIE